MTSLGTAVLFDLDGTLLDHDRAERDAIVDWAVTEGWPSHIDGVDVVSVWHQATEDAFADYGAGNLTFQGQRRVRVRRLLSTIGDERSTLGDDEIDDLFEDFRARYEASWIAYPDVVPCVQAVCMKYRVAVLSNGDLSEKVAKVKAIGLAPFVEVTVASSEIGFAKPDPRAFHGATRMLGVDASDVVHVGDRLDLDVRAATAAGLTSLWLDRKGDSIGVCGVDVIRSLADLPAWLDGHAGSTNTDHRAEDGQMRPWDKGAMG